MTSECRVPAVCKALSTLSDSQSNRSSLLKSGVVFFFFEGGKGGREGCSLVEKRVVVRKELNSTRSDR